MSVTLAAASSGGVLGDAVAGLPMLEVLRASHNRVVGGTIPAAIGGLVRLTDLRIEDCALVGTVRPARARTHARTRV